MDTKKIYLAMAEKGITTTEIARIGGIGQQAVSNALNGNQICAGQGNILMGDKGVTEKGDFNRWFMSALPENDGQDAVGEAG